MEKHKNTIAIALLLTCLANIATQYLAGHPIQNFLFNADALYLPTLLSDLIEKNGHINDWFLTPNPYFFPDYPIFLLAHLLGFNSYQQIIAFALIQTALTFLAIWVLAKQATSLNPLFTAAAATIFLAWLSLTPGQPFYLMLSSSFHYGVFLVAVLFTATWLNYSEKPSVKDKGIFLILAAVLAFVTTLSDSLFLTQVTAPFVATAILISIADRDFSFKYPLQILTVSIASAIGSASYKLIINNHTKPQVDLGLDKFFTNLVDIYEIFFSASKETPLLGLFFLLYAGISLYHFSQLFRAEKRYKKLAWLSTFSFISLCTTIGAVALVTNIPIADRYLISALFWPVIVVFIFLSNHLNRNFIPFATISLLFILAHLSWHSYKLISANGIAGDYYPKDVACIDDTLEAERLTNGISGYWDAKFIQNFAKTNPNIAQHIENLEELHWITSENYFKKAYDFAIINTLPGAFKNTSTSALIQINGNPKAIKKCGDRLIYVYGKNNLHLRKFDSIDGAYTWKACELPTTIGKATPDCVMEKKNITSSGHITYGPYERLPAGQYAFEIAYSSTATKTDTVGDWDVVLALPQEAKVLKNGLIVGSDEATKKITGEFAISSEYNMEKFEIRTLARPNYDLKIIYIRLERRE